MTDKPNILYIQADQHRYDCVGYSRDYPVRTPHLDRLAGEGAWFSAAYTPIPLCGPARQALLNGRRAETFGALWNFKSALPVQALEPEQYAWPRALREAGYRNGFCGKWDVHPRCGPEFYGFDQSASDAEYDRYVKSRYPHVAYRNGWFGEASPLPLADSHSHYMAARAADMMRRFTEEGKPWHIRLDFHDPHLPCRPSEPFASMYSPAQVPPWRSFAEDFQNKPYIQKQQLYNWKVESYRWEDWAPTVAMYYGAISQVDDAVGLALRTLDELGIADRTIVVYTADHGDLCGGHRMMDKHYVMYEDVVKVPLIVRWPEKVAAGAVCGQFVYNMLDLPPTLLEAAGLTPPEFFHGRSLLPLLAGESVPEWRRDVLSTYNGQQFGLYTQRMLRTRNWKYVWNPTDIDELYDLQTDPDELCNRIGDPLLQERLAGLRRRLLEALDECGDGIAKSSWMREQLSESRKLPLRP